MPVALEKVPKGLVDMRKKADQTFTAVGLPPGTTMKVRLLVDRSGSIRGYWANGSLQRLTEAVVALASGLDDDGNVPLTVFESGVHDPGEIELAHTDGALERLCEGGGGGMFHRGRSALPYGSTNLRAGMASIVDQVRNEHDGLGTLVIVVTDGQPDRDVADDVKRWAETEPIFWSFMFIGRDQHGWDYLKRLDDMPGRTLDNTGAFRGEPDAGSDVYSDMIADLPVWLNEAKTRGLVTRS